MNFRFALIFRFVACANVLFGQDEKSINDLRNALIGLSPRTVDPREAALMSKPRTERRGSARASTVLRGSCDPQFSHPHGGEEKGICADYTHDIGAKLREFRFKTLVLHWGAAWPKESDENNALVVTAKNQPFLDGIVLDGWRRGGRLFWCKVKDDKEYESGRHGFLGHLGGGTRTGITAWKEDLQETALLQPPPMPKSESNRKQQEKARR